MDADAKYGPKVLAVIIVAFFAFHFHNKYTKPAKGLITAKELMKYDGVTKPELYLSILGNVFDVTSGARHYGPGETYNIFIGRDNSKGFQTGKVHEDDENINLAIGDLRTLASWLKFYNEQYLIRGKLIGKYYDFYGNLTPYGQKIQMELKRVEVAEEDQETLKRLFPPCNIEWTPNSHTRVWCTKNSGGVKRDWVGVPRRFYDNSMDYERCACIGDSNRGQGMYQEYEDCHSKSTSCKTLLLQ